MKLLILQISACPDCPDFRKAPTVGGASCLRAARTWDYQSGIPEWCPLPNDGEQYIDDDGKRFAEVFGRKEPE